MPDRTPGHLHFEAYKPRNPKANEYYRCVEARFEEPVAIIPIDASPHRLVRVIYSPKNHGTAKTSNALDWLAQLEAGIITRSRALEKA